MYELFLTQSDTFIIGPVAKILGYIMEGIFWVLDKINIPNIGIAIILFTIVIYLLLMPLTYKQQKFSKLSVKMNPELQAVNAKYKGKKDNESMMAMQAETKAVYAKYGVSPSGSCVQLLIQMPILFALYQVIQNIPAYIDKVKIAFLPLVNELMNQSGSAEVLQKFKNAAIYSKQFTNELFTNGNVEYIQNTYVDVLNKASTQEWMTITETYPNLAEKVSDVMNDLARYNNFLGLNLSNSPSFIVKEAWSEGKYLMLVGALLIPILSALFNWLNTKLMPQQNNGGGSNTENQMASTMKMMNIFMPIMSAYFGYILPAGMGIYWIASAVVRGIQQVAINKYIDKMNIDELIEKNTEKYNEKIKKAGVLTQGINNNARMNTKYVATQTNKKPVMTEEERQKKLKDSTEYYNKNAKPGSIASKANMVKQFNEKNNKE